MSAFDHVTPAHVRRLARADLIGAAAMLCLLGVCFLVGRSGSGYPEGNAEGGAYTIVFGVLLFAPYSVLLLLAAGILRLWPRTGYIAHIIAWNWPLLAIVGFAAVSLLRSRV